MKLGYVEPLELFGSRPKFWYTSIHAVVQNTVMVKGKGKSGKKGASVPSLSAQFGIEVDGIRNALMDLNVDEYSIRQLLENIFRIRSRLATAKGKATSKGGKTKEKKRPAEKPLNLHWIHADTVNWKNLYQEWLVSQIRRPINKLDTVYTAIRVQGDEGKTRFLGNLKVTCMVDADGNNLEYTVDEAATSIVGAQMLVARLALFTCNPELHDEIDQEHLHFLERRKMEEPAPKKAKTDADSFVDDKNRLNHGAQMLLGRLLRRGDVVYETHQVNDVGSAQPLYVASVMVRDFDPVRQVGEPCSDKKAAENSAAAKFLEKYRSAIAAKEAARDEKRQLKQQGKERRAMEEDK